MISAYYVPKRPISIPLFNTENQTYTIYFEDSEVEIPADLFFKLFQRVEDEHEEKVFKKDEPKPSLAEFISSNYTREEVEKETDAIRQQLVSRVRLAKMIGVTREQFFDQIKTNPQVKNMTHDKPSFDFMISIMNTIWDEIEK